MQSIVRKRLIRLVCRELRLGVFVFSQFGLAWVGLGGGVILGFLCELIWFSLMVLVWVNLGFILGFLVRVNLGQV